MLWLFEMEDLMDENKELVKVETGEVVEDDGFLDCVGESLIVFLDPVGLFLMVVGSITNYFGLTNKPVTLWSTMIHAPLSKKWGIFCTVSIFGILYIFNFFAINWIYYTYLTLVGLTGIAELYLMYLYKWYKKGK